MGVVDHKQELFQNIVRLRRAGRKLSSDRDIAAVRVTLERELGETVSRRLAARVLGVSHTALDRWIKGGDLPVVYSSKGRMEVPVPALLDLYETVEAERAEGPRRYVLAPAMARQRKRLCACTSMTWTAIGDAAVTIAHGHAALPTTVRWRND